MERRIQRNFSFAELEGSPDSLYSLMLFSGYLKAEQVEGPDPEIEQLSEMQASRLHLLYASTDGCRLEPALRELDPCFIGVSQTRPAHFNDVMSVKFKVFNGPIHNGSPIRNRR